ncbi:MAG TPA: mandelate racemase [Casimicrobiaceae bacterium]|nr:mandelate racemase [Casimicrobiaceae bacterium]
MSQPPTFAVAGIDCFERPVRLRLPFRFGAATLTETIEAFVRADIRLPDGRAGVGATAELMVPKWFDKDPARSNEDNVGELRCALTLAREAYLADAAPRSAFAHFAAHYERCLAEGERRGLPALAAQFGPAEIDRAILDALCRVLRVPFHTAIKSNLVGFDAAAVAPDLAGFDSNALLAGCAPRDSIALRHTIGLLDAIGGHSRQAADGLPELLEEVIAAHSPTWFKLKLSGDVAADLQRLVEIASVLDGMPSYKVTLDGNEQFEDVAGIAALLDAMRAEPRLRRLSAAVAFFEQPVARRYALERDVGGIAPRLALLIDESDATLDAFPRARALGYTGVSSKSCKGLYKSFLNLARCERWNAEEGATRYFLSAEDLTTQAGLSVQQDLALAAMLGIEHVERNGHHYVNGMAGAPEPEQRAFLAAHPDLYERSHGAVRLAIRDGRLALGSLWGEGFASAAMPDWPSLTPQPAIDRLWRPARFAGTATAARPAI